MNDESSCPVGNYTSLASRIFLFKGEESIDVFDLEVDDGAGCRIVHSIVDGGHVDFEVGGLVMVMEW